MPDFSRVSVSEITTVSSTFDEDVVAYSTAGIAGIGVWETKLGGRAYGEAAEALRRAGLRATNLVPAGNSVFPTALSRSPVDAGERVDLLIAGLEKLSVFAPENIVVVTGVDPGSPLASTRKSCISGLRRIVRRAGELGLSVALEPMHSSAADDFSFINSLSDAAALVQEVGEPGLGILYDTWHMGQGPAAADDLAAHVQLVRGVQIADARLPTRSWADRVFPGEGVLPLVALIETLEAGHFAGSYDVEIFSDDGRFGHHFDGSLWELPANVSLERATSLLRSILRSRSTDKETTND